MKVEVTSWCKAVEPLNAVVGGLDGDRHAPRVVPRRIESRKNSAPLQQLVAIGIGHAPRVTFHLDPSAVSAAPVGLIGLLGDDPFQTHSVRDGKELLGVFEALREPQRGAFR
jgi:hypothetical protein